MKKSLFVISFLVIIVLFGTVFVACDNGDTTKNNPSTNPDMNPTSYSITYNLNGGVNNLSNPGTYNEGEEITLQDPVKEGYNFDGWYFESTFATKATKISLNKDVVLYAKWTIREYTITYNLNKGTNSELNPDTYTTEEEIMFSNPTKNGYTFDGWYLDNEFATKIEKIETGANGDITLYAKWVVINYTILYELYGGTNNELNPDTYTIEEEIVFSNPTKNGYTFDGWYLDGSFVSDVEKIEQGNTGNKTIYAKWEIVVGSPFEIEEGTIISYSGNESNLIIPSEHEGKAIVKIGSEVFVNNTSLISVTIPSSIREIEEDAFSGCSSLVSVTIDSESIASDIFSFDDAGCLIKNASNVYILSTVESISEYITKLYDSATSDKVGYNLYTKRANKIILVGNILEEYIDGEATSSADKGNTNTGNGTKAGIYLNGDKCDEYSACLNGRYFVEVVEGDEVTCYIYHQGCRYFCVYEYHVTSYEENQTNDFEFELFLVSGSLYKAGIEESYNLYVNPNDSENPSLEIKLGYASGTFELYMMNGSTLIIRDEDVDEGKIFYEYLFDKIDEPVIGSVIDYIPDAFEEAMSSDFTISGKITILNEGFCDYENVIVKETQAVYYGSSDSVYNYTFVDSEGNYSLDIKSGNDIYVYYLCNGILPRQIYCLIAENVTETSVINKELMLVDYTISVDSFFDTLTPQGVYSQESCPINKKLYESNLDSYVEQKDMILTIAGDEIKFSAYSIDYDGLYSLTGGKNEFTIISGVFSYDIDLAGYKQINVKVDNGLIKSEYVFTVSDNDEYVDFDFQFTDNPNDLYPYRLQLDENIKYNITIPFSSYAISLKYNGVNIGPNTLVLSGLGFGLSELKPMYKLSTSDGDWNELDNFFLFGNENLKYLVKILDLKPIEIDLSKEGDITANFVDNDHYFISLSTTLGGVDSTANSSYKINDTVIPDSIWTNRQIMVDINNTVFAVPSATTVYCELNGEEQNKSVSSNGEIVFEYETENLFSGHVTYNGEPVVCFIDGQLGRFATNIDGTFAVPYKDATDILKFSLVIDTSDPTLYKNVDPKNDGDVIAFAGTTKVVYGQFDMSEDIAGIKFKGLNSFGGKYSVLYEDSESICYTRGEDDEENYIPIEFNDTYLVKFDIIAIQIIVSGRENGKAVPLHIATGQKGVCYGLNNSYDEYNYKTSIIKGESVYGVSSSLSSSGTWYSTNSIIINEEGTYEFLFEKVLKEVKLQYKGVGIDNYCLFASNIDIMIMTIYGSFARDMYVGTLISFSIGICEIEIMVDQTDDNIVLNVLDEENMFVTVDGQITVNGTGCSMMIYDSYVGIMSLTNPDGTFSTIVLKNSVLLTATYYDVIALGEGTYNIVVSEDNMVLDKPYNIDISNIVFASGKLINNKDGMLMLYTSDGWFNYFCGDSYKVAIPNGSSLYMMDYNDFTGRPYKNVILYENIFEDRTDCDFDCTYAD